VKIVRGWDSTVAGVTIGVRRLVLSDSCSVSCSLQILMLFRSVYNNNFKIL